MPLRAAPSRRENCRRYRPWRRFPCGRCVRPPVSLTPGAGYPWGRWLSLRARGLVSAARPRLPGRYRLCRLALPALAV